uniref:Glycosyltransferase 2-like domain-containing protein n=1 Tax=viral metagenome TaxID=1070528 RepID=A0A6C0DP19_9ZZZZ
MEKTIGVVIPCYRYHIPALKRCLDSIEHQTILPTIVFVSCSSSDADEVPEYTYSFPLKIVTHTERKNAAQNRNIGATELYKMVDILSFFDADDEMHPQRLEYIMNSFKDTMDIVLHNYWEKEDLQRDFKIYLFCDKIIGMLRKAPSGCAELEGKYGAKIHHSQVSIRSALFQKVCFKEESYFERREDALFCGDILSLPSIRSTYIKNALSKYHIEGSWYET